MFNFDILDEIKKQLEMVELTEQNSKIYEKVNALISLANDKMNSMYAVFVSDQEIQNLNSWFSSIFQNIKNDTNNPQGGYYNNLAGPIQNCLNILKNIQNENHENTKQNLNQITSNFRAQITKQKTNYDKKLGELDATVKRLENSVKQKEADLLNLTASFQAQFSKAQEERLKEYTQVKQDLLTTINDHKNSVEQVIKKYQDDISIFRTEEYKKTEEFLTKIEELYNIAGEKTVRGGYTKYANRARNFAHTLFGISFTLMLIVGIIVILPLLASISDFIQKPEFSMLGLWEQLKQFNWASLFYRIPVVAILLLPAFYLSSEAKRQRDKEANYRELELKIGAIRPYFEHLGKGTLENSSIPQKEIVQFELAKNLLSKDINPTDKCGNIIMSDDMIKLLECLSKFINHN